MKTFSVLAATLGILLWLLSLVGLGVTLVARPNDHAVLAILGGAVALLTCFALGILVGVVITDAASKEG